MNAILTLAPSQTTIAPCIEEGLSRVERRFRAQLETPIRPVAELCEHVERYRGKMLRPTLVFLAGLACGPTMDAPDDDLVTIATVLEMIHMATLVHDDVLDEASVRRGGDTVNARRGNEAAIILGDYLLSKAFHLCSSLETQRTALRVGEVTSIVCEGEMLQLAHRGDMDLTEEAYFDIIRRKTASLIALSCELGAFHAGGSIDESRRLHDFGERIGTAFQIQDDLLDLTGDERTVGKSLGKDIEKGKLTLPIIHHLAALTEPQREEATRRLLRGAAGERSALAADLHRSGSIAYARRTASALVEDAKALLEPLADTASRAALLALADAVISREF